VDRNNSRNYLATIPRDNQAKVAVTGDNGRSRNIAETQLYLLRTGRYVLDRGHPWPELTSTFFYQPTTPYIIKLYQ